MRERYGMTDEAYEWLFGDPELAIAMPGPGGPQVPGPPPSGRTR